MKAAGRETAASTSRREQRSVAGAWIVDRGPSAHGLRSAFHDLLEVALRCRVLLVLVLAALPAFPVAKEIVQIQRDIALLQEQVRTLQRSVDERLAVTQQLLNQNLEASNRLATSLAVLEKAVHGQEKVMAEPVAGVIARIETLSSQF